jgi:DNA-binding NarL/FixJ family response regulator
VLKILVVDDHLLVREGLKRVLNQVDPAVQVLEAPTAAAALQTATDCADLDLILLDLSLPDQNGFETLPELRRIRNDVPVVVLSGSSSRSDVRRAIQNGASGFIPKSCSAGITLGALRLVLSGGVYIPPDILLTHDSVGNAPGQPRLSDSFRSAIPQVTPEELGLSERQVQVLALLIQGKTNKAIARELQLAEQTVKTHISAVLRALSVNNRTQAVIAVAQLGLNLEKQKPDTDGAPGQY